MSKAMRTMLWLLENIKKSPQQYVKFNKTTGSRNSTWTYHYAFAAENPQKCGLEKKYFYYF